jgi:hypothetical protein
MRPVSVRIMHPEPGPHAGPIADWVADRRVAVAERQRIAFHAAGAADVAVVRGPPDDVPFGARLRALARAERPAGLVILGSGAIPLATAADRTAFVAAAGDERWFALANNRYSADIVAIAHAEGLVDLPDLPGDNELPRWLTEVAGYELADLRGRWRLAMDIDGPLELVLLGDRTNPPHIDLEPVRTRMARIRVVAGDRRAELIVAGRTSSATLAWLERATATRVRAIVEERGLRAGSRLAQAGSNEPSRRPPGSILGALLDRDGPESFGEHMARLADAAVVDTRVLLAHRLGADETAWPPAEDRFASDLLLADRVTDPWLRQLTAAAVAARIPILLGGHSLVGPGVRLLLGAKRAARWS